MDYQTAIAHSQGIRQTAIEAAQVGFRRVSDAVPALRVEWLRKMKIKTCTPANMLAAENAVAPIVTEAGLICDQQIAAAHEQHHDRLRAAAAHFQKGNDSPGNADAPHAQGWLKALLA